MAEVDGASLFGKVWHVTLPALRGVLLITLILQVIGTAQVFIEPYLFTGGGPANATLTILLLIYKYAFGQSLGRGLRRGDGAEPHARRRAGAAVLGVLPAHPILEHLVTTMYTTPGARTACGPAPDAARGRRTDDGPLA